MKLEFTKEELELVHTVILFEIIKSGAPETKDSEYRESLRNAKRKIEDYRDVKGWGL